MTPSEYAEVFKTVHSLFLSGMEVRTPGWKIVNIDAYFMRITVADSISVRHIDYLFVCTMTQEDFMKWFTVVKEVPVFSCPLTPKPR